MLMPDDQVATLKAQQDEFLARRKALLDRFIPFWDGLVERLTEFTTEALAIGLLHVRPCKLRPHYAETGVAELMLNGFNLVLVATDETNHLATQDDTLAARVLIYPIDDPSAKPTADFIAQEISSAGYRVQGRFFGNETDQPFFDGELSREHGHSAANALISFVYSFRVTWEERPMLGIALDRNTPTGSIGFRPPS
jgi:hypothetical protein